MASSLEANEFIGKYSDPQSCFPYLKTMYRRITKRTITSKGFDLHSRLSHKTSAKVIVTQSLYVLSRREKLERAKKHMDEEKVEEKAIRKRMKGRRYKGKHKGRGKYKPKAPA
jgi:hypothetical protein